MSRVWPVECDLKFQNVVWMVRLFRRLLGLCDTDTQEDRDNKRNYYLLVIHTMLSILPLGRQLYARKFPVRKHTFVALRDLT